MEQYNEVEIINRVLEGQVALFEILIRRNNPILYKIGRSCGYKHEDVQDLMQDSYVDAYTHLSAFEKRSTFSTWLAKIMFRNCFRKQRKFSFRKEMVNTINDKSIPMFSGQPYGDTDRTVLNRELNSIIEDALLHVPVVYRQVFVLREINGFNIKETAEIAEISEANVKVRLNRARLMLRKVIEKSFKPEEIFAFNLVYCDVMVGRVMNHLQITK